MNKTTKTLFPCGILIVCEHSCLNPTTYNVKVWSYLETSQNQANDNCSSNRHLKFVCMEYSIVATINKLNTRGNAEVVAGTSGLTDWTLGVLYNARL